MVYIPQTTIDELLAKKLPFNEFNDILKQMGSWAVGPGDIVTSDFRSDHSRFFTKLDENKRVIGGSFG